MKKRAILAFLLGLAAASIVVGCLAGPSSSQSAAPSPSPGRAAEPIAPAATPTAGLTGTGPASGPAAGQSLEADGVVITGQVEAVEAATGVINLNGEAHGFTSVTLDTEVQIMAADGTPRTLEDIKPGNLIQSAGRPIGSGSVLASRIRILPSQT